MASKDDATQDIHLASIADSNDFVNVDDSVATFTVRFEDFGDKHAAVQAAKPNDGIDRVIDMATVLN